MAVSHKSRSRRSLSGRQVGHMWFTKTLYRADPPVQHLERSQPPARPARRDWSGVGSGSIDVPSLRGLKIPRLAPESAARTRGTRQMWVTSPLTCVAHYRIDNVHS